MVERKTVVRCNYNYESNHKG